jgi:hypothetical protein
MKGIVEDIATSEVRRPIASAVTPSEEQRRKR